MQKKPPETPKKPDVPTTPAAGTRKPDAPKIDAAKSGSHPAAARGDFEREQSKSHRHRFNDGEKTTIMPLSEILKARDAARGAVAPPAAVDQFPEFSYQPTVKVAIPAELLKRKQAEAARDLAAKETPGAPAKENTKTHIAKTLEPLRPEITAPGRTPVQTPPAAQPGEAPPPRPQASSASPSITVSGEHVIPDPVSAPAATPAPARVSPDLKAALDAKRAQEIAPAPAESKPARDVKPAAPAAKAEEALPSIAAPMAPPTVPSAPDSSNQVLVFFSCKGGSGATALSTNVAHYCSTSKKKTVLVDLDLQLGDALAAMSLQPGITIAKAMEEAQKGGNMNTIPLPHHGTGVKVLSQVGSLDDLDKISSEGISRFVEGLRANFDTIVVDGVRDFSDNVLAVLDMADKIAIVTVQEVLAIKRARWAFGILRKIGFDGRDITVVINRYANDEMIPFPTLKQMFDPAPVFAVPADSALVLQSLNQGTPLLELGPNHTVTRNISRLAKNLLGEQVEEIVEATVVNKSFWERLRPGKRE